MNSNWIRAALKYAVLLTPVTFLAATILTVVAGFQVAGVLSKSDRFQSAPRIIQKLTRAVYQNVRTHWQIMDECIEFDAEVLYRPRPGLCRFKNAEFDTSMHFDENGFRRTLSPSSPPTGQVRLFVVGDSHAMGWGVEDDETFASYLAAEFGYPTFNLGVSSFGTVRELKFLARAASLATNDIVILQYCDNDFEENTSFVKHGRIGPYRPADLEPLIGYRPTPADPLPIAGLIVRATGHALLQRLRQYGNAFLDRGISAVDPLAPAKMLLAVIEASGITQSHKVIVVAINGPDGFTHLEAGRTILESADVPLLVPKLTSDKFMQIDEHMTPEGHRAVAAAIAKHLAEQSRSTT